MESAPVTETATQTAALPEVSMFAKLREKALTGYNKLREIAPKVKPYVKAAAGALALGMGIYFTMPVSDLIGLAFGGTVAYTGGRWLYETAREYLPGKTQTAIAKFFTRKKDIEVTPKKPSRPTTLLGHAVRITEYATAQFVGGVAFFLGVFGTALGGGLGAAALFWGGPALIAASVVATGAHVVRTAIRLEEEEEKKKAAEPVPTPNPVPDLSPKPTLVARVEAGFNQSATPAQAEMQTIIKPEAAVKPPAAAL